MKIPLVAKLTFSAAAAVCLTSCGKQPVPEEKEAKTAQTEPAPVASQPLVCKGEYGYYALYKGPADPVAVLLNLESFQGDPLETKPYLDDQGHFRGVMTPSARIFRGEPMKVTDYNTKVASEITTNGIAITSFEVACGL